MDRIAERRLRLLGWCLVSGDQIGGLCTVLREWLFVALGVLVATLVFNTTARGDTLRDEAGNSRATSSIVALLGSKYSRKPMTLKISYTGPCGGTWAYPNGSHICCPLSERAECTVADNSDCECVQRPICVSACTKNGNCGTFPGGDLCEGQ
jgi:hypothetical protein